MQGIIKWHLRKWLKYAGIAAGTIALAPLGKSFLPQRFDTETWHETGITPTAPDLSTFPQVEITFLRCGSTTIPEAIAVRGGSFAPTVISHSAVLVRHPKATFLYDTGLCSDIFSYLAGQPLYSARHWQISHLNDPCSLTCVLPIYLPALSTLHCSPISTGITSAVSLISLACHCV